MNETRRLFMTKIGAAVGAFVAAPLAALGWGAPTPAGNLMTATNAPALSPMTPAKLKELAQTMRALRPSPVWRAAPCYVCGGSCYDYGPFGSKVQTQRCWICGRIQPIKCELKISPEILKDYSVGDIEAHVRADVRREMTASIDREFMEWERKIIFGDGSPPPRGIL